MYLLDTTMSVIARNIGINKRNNEYSKIKNSISVLNHAYLNKASIQLKYSLENPSFSPPLSKQRALFSIYNKLIREHQVMFLLFNIFENALRAKAAIAISESFSNRNKDDRWKDITKIDKNLLDPVQKAITKLHRNHNDINNITTFDIFDTFTFGQLENIYLNYWSVFRQYFVAKTFNSHQLNSLSKNQFKSKITKIRNARNDIAHHHPIRYTGSLRRKDLIEDIELILCYLDFNTNDAVNNIDENHQIISLRYI